MRLRPASRAGIFVLMSIAVAIVILIAFISLQRFPGALGLKDEPLYATGNDAREAHRIVLPDILGLVEPIEVVKAEGHWDGLTTYLEIRDSQGKRFLFCVDRIMDGTSDRGMYFNTKHPNHGGKRVKPGGSEEAAVYGLLIRWAESHCDLAPQNGQKVSGSEHCGSVGLILSVLDSRFSAEPFSF